MTGEIAVASTLTRYGINFTANPAACQELNDVLVRNYPCMREGFCTPFGTTQTAFIVWFVIIMLAVFFLAWYLRGRIDEKNKK